MRPRWLGLLLLLGVGWWVVGAAAAADPKVALEIKPDGPGAPRGGQLAVDVFAHIARGWHINAHQPNEPFLIPTELTFTLPPGVEGEEVSYPPPEKRTFAFAGGKELLVYEGKLGLATALRIPETLADERLRIQASLRYQACDNTTCLPPTTVTAVVEVPVVARAAALDVSEPPPAEAAHTNGAGLVDRWMAERGLVFTLLAVALLGLGLNLTPCVYPLISVTVAYFGGQAHGRGRTAWLAGIYVLGIALSFSALGLLAALSGGIFGAALQRPLVVVFIAAVLVGLSLSSFGVYQIQPPAAVLRWAGGSGAGAAGALFMGLTMGIVAAPCVGPIVVGLLVFVGSRQDPSLGFLLFFVLALGMGLPYLGLAVAAGSIKRLPRSGEWLLWTEHLFGCVLLCLAAYFIAPLLSAPLKPWLLPGAIGVSGIFLGFVDRAGRTVPRFPLLKGAVGAGMVALALWLGQAGSVPQAIAWQPIETLPPEAHRDGSRPTLVDFAAEWCIPCREMDHTTYIHPDVVREADRFRMVKADITQENEHTTKLASEFDVRGVPTVILFSPVGAEKQRMVGYVGPEEMLEAMRAVQ